jgi:hypothetical protein
MTRTAVFWPPRHIILIDVGLRGQIVFDVLKDVSHADSSCLEHDAMYFGIHVPTFLKIQGVSKKSFTTILISNAGALAVAVLGTTVPRA